MLYCRYDVELYQRIEHLIGKKLSDYKTEESEVMLLLDRVAEAQRIAKQVRTIQCIVVRMQFFSFFHIVFFF